MCWLRIVVLALRERCHEHHVTKALLASVDVVYAPGPHPHPHLS